MSYNPSYDNGTTSVPCSVTLSYVSPLGDIESVTFNRVSPDKLRLIKKIINSK